MDTERLTICFELLQKLRASLESRLTNWVKVAISASLMCVVFFFAPELFFADTSTLSLFSSNRNRKQLNIGRIFPFRSFFPDLIFIGFQPVMVLAKVTPFSDKSCYAYESLCDLCPRRFRWYYSPQCLFLGSDLFQQSSLKVKAFGKLRRIKKF